MRGTALPDGIAIAPAGALELGDDIVATAGSWERSANEATFTFRFAPIPGSEFAVIDRPVDEAGPWRALARVTAPELPVRPTTIVEAIEPAVASVPANLLRFAVTFSSAMEEGSAAGNLRLLDEEGLEIPGALLEMPPELWDRDHRRLTVLLEPGRIKRGLQPNVVAGAPLREGSSVTLAVGEGLRDATGASLAASAARTYRVGPPIRVRIDPTQWNVVWPDDHSTPIVVRFDRPLDRTLALRYLAVTDRDGHPVAGHAALDAGVATWTFTPRPTGNHDRGGRVIRVDARLEDLAGNSVRRVFDRDLELRDDDGIPASHVMLAPDARPNG